MKKSYLTSLLIGIGVGILPALLIRKDNTWIEVTSDCLFFGGLALLLAALFQLTLHWGFFNGVIYSFKKIVESFTTAKYSPRTSEIGSRPEYEMKHKVGSVRPDMFLAAATMWAVSGVLCAVVQNRGL